MYSLIFIAKSAPIPFLGSARFISVPSWDAEKLSIDLELARDRQYIVDIFDPIHAKNMIDDLANDGSGDDSSECVHGLLFKFYEMSSGIIPILQNDHFEFIKKSIFEIINNRTKLAISLHCRIGVNCDFSCNGRMGYNILSPVSISIAR